MKGFRDDCIKDPPGYFDFAKKPWWFNRQEIKDLILEIDNTIAVKDEYLESPIFGGMSPDKLSSGCKSLILLYMNPLCNVYATRMGDNCVPALLRLANKTDVIVTYHHVPYVFPKDLKAKFLDTGKIVNSAREYVVEYGRITGDISRD